MKKDSLYNYVGKKFLDNKILALNSANISRKCNQFIRRIDSIFMELDKINNDEKRSYIAVALKKQFTHELYNNLKLSITSKQEEFFKKLITHPKEINVEKNIKDEIFGYLKFKTKCKGGDVKQIKIRPKNA